MAAKKTVLPATSVKRVARPAKPAAPATPAARKPSGAGGGAPAWTARATKKAGAPRFTPRKAGGK